MHRSTLIPDAALENSLQIIHEKKQLDQEWCAVTFVSNTLSDIDETHKTVRVYHVQQGFGKTSEKSQPLECYSSASLNIVQILNKSRKLNFT